MEAPRERATMGGEHWTVTTSSSSSSGITDLPSHILAEIMLRLPIKTLVATKRVCKSWLQLINDPQFAKQHQATAKAESEVCFQCLSEERYLYLANFCYPNGSQFPLIKLNTLLQLPLFCDLTMATRGSPKFVNSCNGLLCYVTESKELAWIWNPITSEFIVLPAHDTNNGLPTRCEFGFGFSQKANRFKLLCVMGSAEVVAAKICTIEKGCSWKPIGHCASTSWMGFEFHRFRAFFRGALHWMSKDSHSSDIVIASFDFEDEKFAKVPLPPHLKTTKSNINSCSTLGVLAGCLFVTETTNTSFNVWLMKEYGVQHSWTKVISINFSSAERDKYARCRPISVLDNGEILMMRSLCYLVVYNPVLKSTLKMCFGPYMIRAFSYSPSLVPLKDSIAGFEVRIRKSWRAGLECRTMARTPGWWEIIHGGWKVI